ncbi:MFS transporter [Vibrio sp.]|nr:MFS transporter [Vibrio sp.]
MKGRVLPYLSGRFFDGISSGLFIMALPWLMLKEPNMGTFVALTALACTLTSFVLTPFLATCIDRLSRKFVLIMVQCLQVLTALIVLFLFAFDLVSVWWLALSQVVFWVSSNVAWTANNAFTQENFDKHEYAKISGYQEIILQSTNLGAGALGIVLLEVWGMFEFALFAAGASTLSALSYIVTPYRRKLVVSKVKTPYLEQLKESKQTFARYPYFFAFILISCLSYPVLTYLGRLIPILFSEWNVEGKWVALFNMSFGLGSLFSGFIFAAVLAKYSHQSVMKVGITVIAIMLFSMGLVVEPVMIVGMQFILGIFNALNRISRTNWMHHVIPIDIRGRIDGGLAMFATSVQSLSYVGIAFMTHYNLIEFGFMAIACVVGMGAIGMYFLDKTLRNKEGLIPVSE